MGNSCVCEYVHRCVDLGLKLVQEKGKWRPLVVRGRSARPGLMTLGNTLYLHVRVA